MLTSDRQIHRSISSFADGGKVNQRTGLKLWTGRRQAGRETLTTRQLYYKYRSALIIVFDLFHRRWGGSPPNYATNCWENYIMGTVYNISYLRVFYDFLDIYNCFSRKDFISWVCWVNAMRVLIEFPDVWHVFRHGDAWQIGMPVLVIAVMYYYICYVLMNLSETQIEMCLKISLHIKKLTCPVLFCRASYIWI
jgi:hypothetical protein